MTTNRLWLSNTGRVACDQHGGDYLATAVRRDPTRMRHLTPLDDWIGVNTPETAEGLSCDECRAAITPRSESAS
jgi:hypothetical protein